jgi:hypothetical protein
MVAQPEQVGDGRGVPRVVELSRNFLAEADCGRVDFKRGIRSDRRQRVA